MGKRDRRVLGELFTNSACHQCMGFWECHEIRIGPGSLFSVSFCKCAKLHNVATELPKLFPSEPSGRGDTDTNLYTGYRVGQSI